MPLKPCAIAGCRALVPVGVTHCADHVAEVAAERAQAAAPTARRRVSRKWYNSAAWRGPNGRRARQLAAEPLCRMCPDWSKRPATVADHVVPHRDDHALFWFGELQSLCADCHNVKKQRAERRAASRGVAKSEKNTPQ